MSLPCARRSAWDGPHGMVSPKMVEPNFIVVYERFLGSTEPPVKSVARHGPPSVQRISPYLAFCLKVIGWRARLQPEPFLCIKKNALWFSPNVNTVMRDEKRQVAQNANAVFVCVPFQRLPLFMCKPLPKAEIQNLQT